MERNITAERIAENESVFRDANEQIQRRARRSGTAFLVAPGHEHVAGSSGRVRERRDGYAVVEKIDQAGAVARSRDPRH
jgi:hypothetical protein